MVKNAFPVVNMFKKNFAPAYLVKKPRLLLKIQRRILADRLSGRPSVSGVGLAINFNCNLNCRHCLAQAFYDRTDPGRDCLSTEEIVSTIEDCLSNGIYVFTLQGGEPLLHPDIERIVAACRPSESFIAIGTNGVLLTEERLKRFKELGVDQFGFNINSLVPEEHDDFCRRPGTFPRVFAAMEAAKAHGFRVMIGTAVHNDSMASAGFQDLLGYCLRTKTGMQISIPQRCGNWRTKEDFRMGPGDLAYIDNLNRRYPFIKRDIHGSCGQGGCPAFKTTCYITAKGDVLACPFIHISFGNLRRESLESILTRGRKNPYFKASHERCLSAENEEFIEKILSRTFDAPRLPLPERAVFPDAAETEPDFLGARQPQEQALTA